jgi:hypothetical protein
MSKQTRTRHLIYTLLPTEIEGLDSLAELALDMRWANTLASDYPGNWPLAVRAPRQCKRRKSYLIPTC